MKNRALHNHSYPDLQQPASTEACIPTRQDGARDRVILVTLVNSKVNEV